LQINDGDEDNGSGGGMTVTDFSGDDANELFDLGGGAEGDEGALSLEDMQAGIPRTADLSGTPPVETAPVQQATNQPPVAAPANDVNANANPQPGAQQQPVPGSQPQVQPTQAAPQQPMDFEKYVSENMEALTTQLAGSTFALSPEDKAVVGEEAAPILSKMASRMYLTTQVGVFQALQRSLPGLVANLVHVSNRGNETEQKFFGDFPELKGVNRQALASLGATLRQQNPTMPADQFFMLMARTAAAANGIQLKPVQGKPRPHQPAATLQRGSTPPRGQARQRVGVDHLGNINSALREGD
jgi:hypothetical protein